MVDPRNYRISECIPIAEFLDNFIEQALIYYEPSSSEESDEYQAMLSKLTEFIANIKSASTEIRNKNQSYRDEFFSQRILEKIDITPGLLFFLSKCVILLQDPVTLDFFLCENRGRPISFLSLVTKLQAISDEPKQVYTLFAYIDYLLDFQKWSYSRWEYFQDIESVRVTKIPIDQRSFFLKRLLHPKFMDSYIDLIEGLNPDIYETAVTTALFRTYLVNPIVGFVNGFSTANLFILIQQSIAITNNLRICGNFIKLIHELGHYLRRCKSRVIGDSQKISTPPNIELSISEGGTIAVRKIFGGEVKFIPASAADFFMSEDFILEQFKEMLVTGETPIPSDEQGLVIRWKGYEHGCVSKFIF